ncbi:MFS transporter [Streptomyces sp. NBC_01465]|uniref:MFS transporter n=1 Tax=Streptomyces sp. NBC_01465 TaxID=2903878 RepID=UPI002E36BF37|nr:MFS transporter [Streptomyces sp. NBC_01465]
MPPRPRAAATPVWPLVALFTAGYLAAYLLPTTVARLGTSLQLGAAQAGLMGSSLLLASATAGFVLASRVERIGPHRLARTGLLLMFVGYGTAAATATTPLVLLGAVVGGFGSGTATTVAASSIAAQRDPHRASALGLLSVSATAGALYLTIPHLGGGHRTPLLALAALAVCAWPAAGRIPAAPATHTSQTPRTPLPYLRAGLVLAGAIALWSLAQNSLWGVSSRIGLDQAGLSEVTVGAVFAAGLGAGLLGVTAATALGARLGRALPIGAGTAVIAVCIATAASADGLTSFATGEIAWNAIYPVVLSYLIGLAASLDPRGRWAVLVGSASSLGTACGPVTGSTLAAHTGFPAMGQILCVLLLLLAVPMTAVALHTAGRPLVPGAVRRRGGAPAALLSATAGATPGTVPQLGAPEQPVAEIEVAALPPRPLRIRTTTKRTQPKSYASTSAK